MGEVIGFLIQVILQSQLQNADKNFCSWRSVLDLSEYSDEPLPKEFLKDSKKYYPDNKIPFNPTFEYELDKLEKNGVFQEQLMLLEKFISEDPNLPEGQKIKILFGNVNEAIPEGTEPRIIISPYSSFSQSLDLTIVHEIAHIVYEYHTKDKVGDNRIDDGISNFEKFDELYAYYKQNKDSPNIKDVFETSRKRITEISNSYENEDFRREHFHKIWKGPLREEVIKVLLDAYSSSLEKADIKKLKSKDLSYDDLYKIIESLDEVEGKKLDYLPVSMRNSPDIYASNLVISAINNTPEAKFKKVEIRKEYLSEMKSIYEIDPKFHKAYTGIFSFMLDPALRVNLPSESHSVDIENLYLNSIGREIYRDSYVTTESHLKGANVIVYSDNHKQYHQKNTHSQMKATLRSEKDFNYQMASYWNEVFDINKNGFDMDVELSKARQLIDELTKNGFISSPELKKLEELQTFLKNEFKIDTEINKENNLIRIKGFYSKSGFVFKDDSNNKKVNLITNTEKKANHNEIVEIALEFAKNGFTEEEIKALSQIKLSDGSCLDINSKDIFIKNIKTGETTHITYDYITGKVNKNSYER